MRFVVREASPEDGPALQEIERAAGERFREVGMSSVADDEPASIEELAEYANEGRSWVAIAGDGEAVGYVLVDVVDGNAHVEQVSVGPRHQGAGIGRALIDRVSDWAVEAGAEALTLTTFTDVPWNAPLYERLGFRVMVDEEVGPELRELVAEEAEHGLDPAARVCMRRDARSVDRHIEIKNDP